MQHIALVVVFLASSCSLITTFDEDQSGNNVNNTNNINNTAGPEICDNFSDDDGDGLSDCKDPDCEGQPQCECRLDNAFFDSIDGCPAGEACVIKLVGGGGDPLCLDESRIAGGDFYESCGISGECPFGSFCSMNVYTGRNECQPWCSPQHPKCPGDGFCAYFEEEETPEDALKVCVKSDGCYPPSPASCGGGDKGCYLVSEQGGTRCLDSGTTPMGMPCDEFQECAPGLVCLGANDPQGGTCLKWCDTEAENPCTGVNLPNPWCFVLGGNIGVCVPE
ncbi:hypothetical protein KKF84_00750 [Myxococcota bacterium]|nr:hypothetical protein [Myxococcota bacterium]